MKLTENKLFVTPKTQEEYQAILEGTGVDGTQAVFIAMVTQNYIAHQLNKKEGK